MGNESILSHHALGSQDRPTCCPDVLTLSEGNRAQICFFPVSSYLAESRLEKRICRVILASKVLHPPLELKSRVETCDARVQGTGVHLWCLRKQGQKKVS